MLKIGVLGAGHLGKIHLKLLQQIETFELVGFYDLNRENAHLVSQKMGIKSFDSVEELVSQVDVVDIVTPTSTHFELAQKALQQKKHIFVEKPFTRSLEEATQLIEMIEKAGVKAQIGHIERFNPAFLAVEQADIDARFIEVHRLAQFNPRGTDVSVVLDLMIHDLDVILSLVKSKVKHISANGVAVISETTDIANARIEFENACVVNITASRLSLKNMRKMRIFQPNAYVSIDFLEKKTEVISLTDNMPNNLPAFSLKITKGNKDKHLILQRPQVAPSNALKMELESFADCILKDTKEIVSMYDAYDAMFLAHQIIEHIKKNTLKQQTCLIDS
ncbi:MAG: Gfo/Idh/MocA family protein [Chitinophagales bacterium]